MTSSLSTQPTPSSSSSSPSSPATDLITTSSVPSTSSSLSLDQLPTPILISILSHITSFNFFSLVLPLISKRFRALIPRLEHHFRQYTPDNTSSSSTLTSTPTSWERSSSSSLLPSLRSTPQLFANFSRCKAVAHWDLFLFLNKWNQFSSLITMIDISHSKWEDDALEVFSCTCSRLQTFIAVGCRNITSAGLQHLVAYCLELQDIDVSDCKNLQWSVDSLWLPSYRFVADIPEGDEERRIIVPACHDPNDSSIHHALTLMSIAQKAEKILLRVRSSSSSGFNSYTVDYLRLSESTIRFLRPMQRATLDYLIDSAPCHTIEEAEEQESYLDGWEEGEEEARTTEGEPQIET